MNLVDTKVPLTREEWVTRGQEMIADRQRRIARAKHWRFDTVATHGVYDLEQAMELNNGSIMEPVYLSPAQAYRVMMQVHSRGVGVAGTYSFEVAETKVADVHDLAKELGHPLRASMEEA